MKSWSWVRSMWSGLGGRGGWEPTWWVSSWERIGLGGLAALLFLGFWLLSFWYSGLAIWGSAGIVVGPWACVWLWFALRGLEKELREYRTDVRRLLAWDPDGQWRREYFELEERVRLYRGPSRIHSMRIWILLAAAVSGLAYDHAEGVVQGRVVMVRRLEHLDEPLPVVRARPKVFDVDSFLEKEAGVKR